MSLPLRGFAIADVPRGSGRAGCDMARTKGGDMFDPDFRGGPRSGTGLGSSLVPTPPSRLPAAWRACSRRIWSTLSDKDWPDTEESVGVRAVPAEDADD